MATRTRATRARPSRPSRASRERTASLSIRCKVNGLPVKAILYALLYVMSKGEHSRKAQQSGTLTKAKDSIRVLRAVNTKLRANDELDPVEMHDILDITASSYVSFYYSLESAIRADILEDDYGRMPKDENILTMPALMMMRNAPKGKVVHIIRTNLYRKPLVFLRKAIVASRKMETLRASMSLKKSTDFTSDRLSYSFDAVEELIGRVDTGLVKPKEDEEAKARLIDDLVGLSERYDAHTLQYIKSKLDETSFNLSTAQRVIRQ